MGSHIDSLCSDSDASASVLVLILSSLGLSERPFLVAAASLTTVLATVPVAKHALDERRGVERSEYRLEDTLNGATGTTALISPSLNGSTSVAGHATEGLEGFLAVAIAAAAGATVYNFAAVRSPASPAGTESRRRAEEIRASYRASTTAATSELRLETQEEAAAEIGRQDIAAGFRQYADGQEGSARAFLILGVLIFAGSVAAALYLVTKLPDGATVAATLTRASLTIPGAVVFGVFVAEAGARRRYAAWGFLIAIQAEHLGPFTSALSSDLREDLEAQFGRAVFRGGDVALDSSSASGIFGWRSNRASDQPTQTASITQLLSEVIKLTNEVVAATSKSSQPEARKNLN